MFCYFLINKRVCLKKAINKLKLHSPNFLLAKIEQLNMSPMHIRSIFKVSLISLALGLFQARPIQAFTLSIFHNNDSESALLPRNSEGETDLDGDIGGAARFVSLIDTLRSNATTDATITLSSGDNFLAGTAFNASLENGTFYDAVVLDAINYDAIALGNHDFDFGTDVLADFISSPQFSRPVPYLSANLDFSNVPELQNLVEQGRIAASTVVEKAGERIGVVGATTPALRSISSPGDVEIEQDVAGEVQAEIDALLAQGVDKIILISHLQSVENDLELIPQLSGVDIAIAGGGDELLANADDELLPGDESSLEQSYPLTVTNAEGRTVPVVTTAGQYGYVGQLEVEFDEAGNVIDFDGGPQRVFAPDGIESDPQVQEQAIEPVAESIAALEENAIATSEVPLNGEREAVRTEETNFGNLIADALLATGQALAPTFGLPIPDVALQNGGGIRNDSTFAPGEFTELDTFDALPFPNFVTVVPNVTASQFKEILENAVSQIEEVGGRFAQIAGFEFAYDPDASIGTRVRMVVLNDGTVIVENGEVVAGAPDITISTIDFLAQGGDDYPFGDADFTSLGVSYQQALENFVSDLGTITAQDYPVGGEGRITTAQAPSPPQPETVPEPTSVLGLLALGLGAASLQHRKSSH